jgi:leader peptidase (prepilin peptidase)/N-methyltransferase
MIEMCYGTVFVLLYRLILIDQPSLLISTLWLLYYTALFGVLGVMALYDREHSYVPFSFLAPYLLLTLLMFGVRVVDDPHMLNFLSPVLVALPFLVIWLITKGRGLGFGDVILFFGVGAFFGVSAGFAVFALSVWVGAVVGVYLKYFKHKGRQMSSAMPFVPFIVLAFLFVLFTGIDIFSVARIFS